MGAPSQGEGARVFIIPDGFLPRGGEGIDSHEAICVRNSGTETAHLVVTAYYADRPPAHSAPIPVPGERDVHLHLDAPAELGGLSIPQETPYGLRISSDRPVVLQHSRMDTRLGGMALFTTMGFVAG